jgi:hypothetical protein
MTTAGDNITKANITASMEALKSFNSGIVWHTGNTPFSQGVYVGGDASGYATQNYANDISDTNITASTLVANFKGYATLLSRIRNVRLVKYYQSQGDPRASITYDETQMTNLNGDFITTFNTNNDPGVDTVISATVLDDFVTNLSVAINANRTSTVTIEEFYCHSNCHGSCHGSL